MSTFISDSEKVDFLLKKVGYELSKTDLVANKIPSNEVIASPITVGSQNVWLDPIPTDKNTPSSVVEPFFIRLVPDTTSQPGRAWIEPPSVTNRGNWISLSYGNYGISCFSGLNTNTTYSTSTHSGIQPNNGAFFIDYAAGVINFAGVSSVTANFTGINLAVYVSGFRYIGAKGSTDTARKSLDLTQFSGTTSASGFRNKIDGTTGSGSLVFQSGATLTKPAIYGDATFFDNVNVSGTLTIKGGTVAVDTVSINAQNISGTNGSFTNSLTVGGTGVSLSGHTHPSSAITDLREAVEDIIGSGNQINTGFLRNGSGLKWTYTDNGTDPGTLSIGITGVDLSLIPGLSGYFSDNLNTSLVQSTGIDLTYDSNLSRLLISVTGIPSSLVTNFNSSVNTLINSAISGNISGGSGITLQYDNINNKLTINANVGDIVNDTIVRTSGAQTISGIKTFTATPVFSSGLSVSGAATFNSGLFVSGDVAITGNISGRAPASNNVATQIVVFTGDPSSTTRGIVTRTPSQLIGDIAAVATTGNQIIGGIKSFTGIPVFSGSYSEGQLFIGSTTGLIRNTLSNGTGISISNGNGTITINVDSAVVRTSDSQTINGLKTFGNTATFNSGLSANNQRITSVATPSADSDAATKGYVDGLSTGLDFKASVRVATTGNIAYSSVSSTGLLGTLGASLPVFDGITLASGNRVLLKNQTITRENGIYIVANTGGAGQTWTLNRAPDADSDAEVTAGMFVFVEEGTTNADTGWVLSTNNPIAISNTVGSGLDFVQFSAAGQIVAVSGLARNGNNVGLASAYGDTVFPFGTKTRRTVLAGPTGNSADAVPTFRELHHLDIPSLGNITNLGAIGTTTNLPIITTTNGVLTTGSFGSTQNSFCAGDDARLNNILYTSGTQTISGTKIFTSIPTFSGSYNSGQILIGGGTGLILNTLSSGDAITITNGNGSITLGIDSTVARTSGVQTISGVKTFANNTVFGSGLFVASNVVISGNISGRAPAGSLSATHIPVFTGDPSSTTRAIVTRLPSELVIDIGAVATTGTQTVSGVKTFANNTVFGSGLFIASNVVISGNISGRAPSSSSAATQIPVFTSDPSSTTQGILTRTPSQFVVDIGAVATTGDQTVSGVKTFDGSGIFNSGIRSASGNAWFALGLNTTPSNRFNIVSNTIASPLYTISFVPSGVSTGTTTIVGNTSGNNIVYLPSGNNGDGTLALLSNINTSQITGTLSTNKGGTGQSSYNDGELLIGNTSTTSLVKAKLTEGTGIVITNGAGSITINHSDTSALSGLQGGFGIKSITVDNLGHVTAIETQSSTSGYLTSSTVCAAIADCTIDGGTF